MHVFPPIYIHTVCSADEMHYERIDDQVKVKFKLNTGVDNPALDRKEGHA